MNKFILQKATIERLGVLFSNYIERIGNPDALILHNISETEKKSIFNFMFEDRCLEDSWLIDFVSNYLKYSVCTGHKNFTNQLFTGINDISVLAEVITSFTNTTMAVREASPIATHIENALIDEVLSRTGFNKTFGNGEGIMTPGGSYSIMMALIAARNYSSPDAKKNGIKSNMVVLTSDHAHYSVNNAASIIGIGENNVVPVKTDSKAKMIPKNLEEQIKEQISKGKVPFCIILNSGTTEFGSFDPIIPAEKIAKKYNIWLHIDGAWGGAVIFSKKNKLKLKGLEKVDSFNWDAHKILGIPLYASVFVVNKPKGTFKNLFGLGNGNYLLHGKDDDLGNKSLQCARRNDALKVWLLFKYYGLEYVQNTIDQLITTSKEISNCVKLHPDFKLIMEPEFLNICFKISHITKNRSSMKLHSQVRENLIKAGEYFFNYSVKSQDKTFFRYIVNTESSIPDFTKMLDRISKEVQKVIASNV